MTFAAPAYLIALIGIPILGLTLVRSERARRHVLRVFGAPELLAESSRLPNRRDRALGHSLVLVALSLGIVALARPQGESRTSAAVSAGADVLFVLDLSRSMGVTDVAPSRLGAAKQAMTVIAHALPNDRVGLVVFGGSAVLSLSPTLDHSTFQTFLDAAEPIDVPDPSTNLEDAVGVATAALDTSEEGTSRSIVLLSDGEDEEGKLEQAIQTLSKAHVRAFVIGVGTSPGGVVPDRDSVGLPVPHRDALGQPVVSHLVELNLQDIARRTGGAYVHWTGAPGDVWPIIDGLRRLPLRFHTGSVHGPEADEFQWPLALAFGLLLLGSVVEMRAAPEDSVSRSRA
jgi:Ca-activated chloride channel family protein